MKALVLAWVLIIATPVFSDEIPTEYQCNEKTKELRAQLLAKVGMIASNVQARAAERAKNDPKIERNQADLLLVTGGNLTGRSNQVLETMVQGLASFCRQVGDAKKIIDIQ